MCFYLTLNCQSILLEFLVILFKMLYFHMRIHFYWLHSGVIHKPCGHGRGKGLAKCPCYYINLIQQNDPRIAARRGEGLNNVRKTVTMVYEWPFSNRLCTWVILLTFCPRIRSFKQDHHCLSMFENIFWSFYKGFSTLKISF